MGSGGGINVSQNQEAIGIGGPLVIADGGPLVLVLFGGRGQFIGPGSEAFADFTTDDRRHGEYIGQGY
jgi:hypothetical protein